MSLFGFVHSAELFVANLFITMCLNIPAYLSKYLEEVAYREVRNKD